MKKGLTELVFILDRSGSMAGLTTDTIGGFNSMIEKQKKDDEECYVSTVLFNEKAEVLHDRVPIHEVKEMTEREYCAMGSTALVDALGGAIHHIGNVHKYAREEDVPEHTLFVVTTDGMENASVRYTADQVREMVKRQQDKYGWEFLFLGANMDAVETARHYGFKDGRAARYAYDRDGVRGNFDALSEAIINMKRRGVVRDDWADDVRRMYEEKNGGNQQ